MPQQMSNLFPQTRRSQQENPGQTRGHALLERAGFIRPSGSAGIYTLMPLGFRVHEKIKAIIYDEMEHSGVQNVQLPILQSRELWEATGRWKQYSESGTMYQTREPNRGAEFGLAPTAEEIVTATVAADLRSFRQLPLILHQIGPKFRAEQRPRMGMLRAREFEMSDAYSFDRDEEAMRASFELMREIYTRIFNRLGLEDVISVKADSGAIGGSGSAEFMALSDVGEDTLLTCDACDYGANREKADSHYGKPANDAAEPLRPLEDVYTPGVATIEQLCSSFPGLSPRRIIKTLIYADLSSETRDLVAVCIRADLNVQDVKLSNEIGGTLEPATPEEVQRATGARVGYAGPLGIPGVTRVVYDGSIEGMRNFVVGANRSDRHLLNVNFGRDLGVPPRFYNVHAAADGHGCPECAGDLVERRGIEIGHVFQLQHRYSKLGAQFTTEAGEKEDCWMGCYGIGTTRVMQAIAEACNDEHGLMWPQSVAPYDVHVLLTEPEKEPARALLAQLVDTLEQRGLSALVDERQTRPGSKFADADLIGCPVRVTIGRGAAAGLMEIRRRGDMEVLEVSTAEAGGRLAA